MKFRVSSSKAPKEAACISLRKESFPLWEKCANFAQLPKQSLLEKLLVEYALNIGVITPDDVKKTYKGEKWR